MNDYTLWVYHTTNDYSLWGDGKRSLIRMVIMLMIKSNCILLDLYFHLKITNGTELSFQSDRLKREKKKVLIFVIRHKLTKFLLLKVNLQMKNLFVCLETKLGEVLGFRQLVPEIKVFNSTKCQEQKSGYFT